MAERKIEPTYGIEAFVNQRGAISLKQYNPYSEEEIIVQVELRDVETVRQWLAELALEADEYEVESDA